MKLDIIAYKLIVFVEGVGCRSVEFVKSNTKKLYIGIELFVSRFCSYFVQNSKKK